jgi:hypothetical protein
MYTIHNKHDVDLVWVRKVGWIKESEITDDVDYFYETKRGKLPIDGVWDYFDEHVACRNWPNCDDDGCGDE